MNPLAQFFSSILNPVADVGRNLLTKFFPTETIELRNSNLPRPTPKTGPGFDQPMLHPGSPGVPLNPQTGVTGPAPTPFSQALSDFTTTSVPSLYEQLINQSAQEQNLHPALLAALLFQESRFNPKATGSTDPNDIGIAQINLPSHPQVKKEQALDPSFAIPFAAKKLASDLAYFKDLSRALAAYNVGRGGVEFNLGQDTPFGGGDKGQTYINNVARNLSPGLIESLGLKTSF